MEFLHAAGVKPTPSTIELGRGADGVVLEVLDHPELVVKEMNHPFKLGRNRIALELRVLHAVLDATAGRGATRVFSRGTVTSANARGSCASVSSTWNRAARKPTAPRSSGSFFASTPPPM
jgi:hypothetical protein